MSLPPLTKRPRIVVPLGELAARLMHDGCGVWGPSPEQQKKGEWPLGRSSDDSALTADECFRLQQSHEETANFHWHYDQIVKKDRNAFPGTLLNTNMAVTMNEHLSKPGPTSLDISIMGVMGQQKPGVAVGEIRVEDLPEDLFDRKGMMLLLGKDASEVESRRIFAKVEAISRNSRILSCHPFKFGFQAHYASKAYLEGRSVEERAFYEEWQMDDVLPVPFGPISSSSRLPAESAVQCSVQNLALLKRNASSSGSLLAERTGEHASESKVCLLFRKPSGGRNW